MQWGVSFVLVACFECRIFSACSLDLCIVLLPPNHLIHEHSPSMFFFVLDFHDCTRLHRRSHGMYLTILPSFPLNMSINPSRAPNLHILPSSPLNMSISLPPALNLQPTYSLYDHMFHSLRYSDIPYLLTTIPSISSCRFGLGTSEFVDIQPSSVSLLYQISQCRATPSLVAMPRSIVGDSKDSKATDPLCSSP